MIDRREFLKFTAPVVLMPSSLWARSIHGDIGSTGGGWILTTGFWNDTGVWDNTAVWKDGP